MKAYFTSQSSTILQQFQLMMEELNNFTKQGSSNIIEMTQAPSATQEHTGKLIEDVISKALAKSQDTTMPLPNAINTSTRNLTYTSPTYDSHQTSMWPPSQQAMSFTPIVDFHQTYHCQESQTNKNSDCIEHQVHQIPPDFNQSLAALLRHQTELGHSTQCLHQQTTDVLHNITKSTALQENLHFIHDIPIFKAKIPQSFDEWLDQIDKVTALTNNDHYKLALAKSQGSFSKTISSYPPTLGCNKMKECLHYNFGSVATKQHATSMLIDQQQSPLKSP